MKMNHNRLEFRGSNIVKNKSVRHSLCKAISQKYDSVDTARRTAYYTVSLKILCQRESMSDLTNVAYSKLL